MGSHKKYCGQLGSTLHVYYLLPQQTCSHRVRHHDQRIQFSKMQRSRKQALLCLMIFVFR